MTIPVRALKEKQNAFIGDKWLQLNLLVSRSHYGSPCNMDLEGLLVKPVATFRFVNQWQKLYT